RSMFRKEGITGIVEYGDERYWMNIDHIDSDVEYLEKVMSKFLQPETGSDSNRSIHVREVMMMYRGGYFETEHYEWANQRRSELHDTYLKYLEQLYEVVDRSERELLLWKLLELEPDNQHYYD